jgi:large subunit ribosomal protein L5
MSTVKYTPRLADKYTKEVVPALSKKFGYKSVKNLHQPWCKWRSK